MKENSSTNAISFLRIAIIATLLWTLTLGGLFYWSAMNEMRQYSELARMQTSAFFDEFLMTRFWNAMHRGLYAPITKDTPPNPFLEYDPYRDLETTAGIKLTKINPAYMTRQVAAVTAEKSHIRFHLTAPDPINPENEPDAWETAVFNNLNGKNEFFELVTTEQGEKVYRYLSRLYLEQDCLECHSEHGQTFGSSCGGISVSVPATPFLEARNAKLTKLAVSYMFIWLVGLVAIIMCNLHLYNNDKERSAIIAKLQASREEVKQLSGMLPICCSCKNIRDDSGYWQRVEQYIGDHADIEFTHGICPDCAKKLYPDFCDKE